MLGLGLEALYEAYKTDVYRYLLSLVKKPTFAEDLLSETFLRALQRLGSYEARSGIKTWLFGIARNVWLESLRKHRSVQSYDDLLELYLEDSLVTQVHARKILARVHTLLEKKDARTRKIISMRAKGYPYTEIAQHLQIMKASARVLEHRTRIWLKQSLETKGLWNGDT